MQLTDEQQAAVELITVRRPRLSILTGGPGTGKTTTIKGILQTLRGQGRTVALAAPSGKAAQRMEEATGAPASTIHRLLGLSPRSPRPEPLFVDVLILDEASMVDVELLAMVCKAVRAGSVQSILLVGDPDQLPPVGPGQPFADLLESEIVPTVRLTRVQRQAEESGIVRAAYAIRGGKVPDWAPDLQLVTCPDSADVPAVAWRTVNELEMDPRTSQILAPQRTGPCGTEAVNDFFESARAGKEKPDLLRGKFAAGTKVIHTKNNYDLGDEGVFNGELGVVAEVELGVNRKGKPAPGKDRLLVRIAGQLLDYTGALIKQLEPAWALTVHRSQGSEWRDVVVVAHPSQAFMLTRSLLYVALTRAKQRVVVVGTPESIARAVRKVKDVRRATNLKWMLAEERERRAAQAGAVA